MLELLEDSLGLKACAAPVPVTQCRVQEGSAVHTHRCKSSPLRNGTLLRSYVFALISFISGCWDLNFLGGEKVRTSNLELFPKRSWPAAASFDVSRKLRS